MSDSFISARAPGFAQILRAERDHPELWSDAIPGGIPFWLVIRYMFARAVEDAITGSVNFQAYRHGIPLPSLGYIRDLLKQLLFSNKYKKFDIMFVSSDTAVMKYYGRALNRLTDYFGLCYPQSSLMLEISLKLSSYGGRALPNYSHYELTHLRSIMSLGKIIYKNEKITRQINNYINTIKPILPEISNDNWQEITSFLYKTFVGQEYYIKLINNMLNQVQPKILLCEDGCYGYHATLIYLAKKRGIKVVEFQHGMISKNHEAYNYHPDIHHKIREFLPDYFLLYGDWWKNAMAIPSQCIAIGNPFFSEYRRFKPEITPNPESILFVSSGMQPLEYCQIILELNQKLPHYHITIRKHPLETYPYNQLQNISNISIDTNQNINESIAQHRVVIGDISTGLFEAKAQKKQVFSLNSTLSLRHIPEIIPFFANVDDLIAMIHQPDIEPDFTKLLFTENWQENYRHFMNGQLGLG